MARSFCRTLTLHRITCRSLTPHCVRIQSNHFSSSHNQPNQLTDDASSEALIRKLEDAIHLIIARRSAPDWLPFVPGSSYWVPPINNKAMGLPSLLAKLTDPPLSPVESLSTTTVRGWPSSSYFIYGGAPHLPETESSSSTSQPEDEEG